MKVGWIGLGQLGLPCALAVESRGHEIAGWDASPEVRHAIESRTMLYEEEGAQELLDKTKLRLVLVDELIQFSELLFLVVQTPHQPLYEGIDRLPKSRKDFHYGFLRAAAREIAECAEQQKKRTVMAVISTVLPGTMDREVRPVLNEWVALAYNPAFPAMQTAIPDFLDPEFALLGVDDLAAADLIEEFYETIHSARVFRTDVRTAELIKVAYNCAITSKIDMANMIMELAHKVGANCSHVTEALRLATKRVASGAYLEGGVGDGGKCHPRDSIAMSYLARSLDLSYDWFEHLMICRERQTEWLADLIQEYMGIWRLPLVLLGKAFKPKTNITTGSAALLLANILAERGVVPIVHYDPYVDDEESATITGFTRPALIFVATKHPEFQSYHFPKGGVVLDPFGYVADQEGVEVVRIGRR